MKRPIDLRIVQVVRSIHPFGGVGGVAFFLKQAFERLNVETSVIAHHVAPYQGLRALEKLTQAVNVIWFSLSGTWQILSARHGTATVILVHGDAVGGDIYVDHGLHKAVVRQKLSMLVRNPLHLFLLLREELRHRCRTYRYVVSLSAFSEKLLLENYRCTRPDAIVRIPNGVDVQKFSVPRDRDDFDGLRLIFVGHEYERKGLNFVIEALASLPPNVTLSIVGGSAQEIASHSSLAERYRVADRARFLGRRSDVQDLLARHDLLILPSRFESWQLVVLEAMAAGVPVLATPVGCAPEVVVDGETGFLVDRSSASISEKVALIWADRALLGRMRTASRKMAEKYSWEQIASRYVALARRVLEERTRLK